MQTKITEIAKRIKGLREMLNIETETMAEHTGTDLATYIEYENGNRDFGFTFLYKCAEVFNIDIVELLTGDYPKLSVYSIIRSGKGLDMKRRKGFTYEHLAYKFQNKISEPFLVTAPYIAEEQDKEIVLSTHEGQELDYILSGKLKVQIENHTEILYPGDCIYYDSSKGHGMIAIDGEDCKFLAIVMKSKKNKSEGDSDA